MRWPNTVLWRPCCILSILVHACVRCARVARVDASRRRRHTHRIQGSSMCFDIGRNDNSPTWLYTRMNCTM